MGIKTYEAAGSECKLIYSEPMNLSNAWNGVSNIQHYSEHYWAMVALLQFQNRL
jgi:hypothetical protein